MKIRATASPNIAFIKYWGKKPSLSDLDKNIGVNASASMTLSKALTTVDISESTTGEHQIFINESPANDNDTLKILQHIQRIEQEFSLVCPKITIKSSNNFPASAGIASSASAFCALTIGICAAVVGKEKTQSLLKNAPNVLSRLSRRGSGSAARSIAGGFMLLESDHAKSIDSDWELSDTIVIFSASPKKISSTDGHKLALTSPEFAQRLKKLPQRTELLLEAIKNKNLQVFGEIIEEEALEMHRIAETSTPPVVYLTEASRAVIKKIQSLKNRDFYITIDAGPNLHIVSEKSKQTFVVETLKSLLKDLQLDAELWQDTLGRGPTLE